MVPERDDGVHLEGESLEQFLLALSQNVIKLQQRNNPGLEEDAAQFFGEATVTAGRLLVRGVPVDMVIQATSQVMNVPGDVLSDFVVMLRQMIAGIAVTDSTGTKRKLRIPERPDFSLEKDWMDHMRLATTCQGAFVNRDYARCVRVAEEALETHSPAGLFQLLVISLQRLKRSAEATRQGERALRALTFAPWHRSLMAVTLGRGDPAAAYQSATNDDQRCQARYYEGARAITVGDTFAAKLALEECVRTPSGLMEKLLAAADLKMIQ
jgi:hypothetical protein